MAAAAAAVAAQVPPLPPLQPAEDTVVAAATAAAVEPPAILQINQLISPNSLTDLKENLQVLRIKILTRLESADAASAADGTNFTTIDISVFPFDTIDDIKSKIFVHMRSELKYLPKFLFLGLPIRRTRETEQGNPDANDQYQALDYLWYPPGVSSESQNLSLQSPLASMANIQSRFRTSDGSFPAFTLSQRNRTLIEDIFTRVFSVPADEPKTLPVLHAFPLSVLVRGFGRRLEEISESDWNGRFRPFFPSLTTPAKAVETDNDRRHGEVLVQYMNRRERSLNLIGELLELPRPRVQVDGVKQLRLVWGKKFRGYEGSEHLFYRLRVTDRRVFIRYLPTQGTAVTKLHVRGVVPVPTISDPELLPQWAKESSPASDKDFLYLKYLHRNSLGSLPAIYGTVRVFEEGTADLLLQPPKKIRKLELEYDFNNFNTILSSTLEGFPAEINARNFTLGEISLIFNIGVDAAVGRFTYTKLAKRIAFLQPFFQEIGALPELQPIIAMRYKAVSQFATEDRVGTFLTQFATRLLLQGEGLTTELIRQVQSEFAMSDDEARSAVARWFENRGAFTVAVPEDGDFVEAYNPGIDLYITGQHPSYSVHCHRIDSFHTFQRIYTLLGILFFEDDDYFTISPRVVEQQRRAEEVLEREELNREAVAAGVAAAVAPAAAPAAAPAVAPAAAPAAAPAVAPAAAAPTPLPMPNVVAEGVGDEADEMPDFFMAEVYGDANVANGAVTEPPQESSSSRHAPVLDGPGSAAPDVEEGPAAGAAGAAAAAALPRPAEPTYVAEPAAAPAAAPAQARDEEREKLVNPASWFLKKLKEVDRRLFDFNPTPEGELGYARSCAANDDRMPNILTREQYRRMRTIYEFDEDIEFIELPLSGEEEPMKKAGYEQYFVLRFGSNPANPNYFICPQYFCLLDEILVRPKDFVATRDRDGRPKPANTCPFCHGKLITSKKAVAGHTVYKRKNKPKADVFHSYINFLKKTSHPEKFMLPCCFIEPSVEKTGRYRRLIRPSDEAFEHFRTAPSAERRIEMPLAAAAAAATSVPPRDAEIAEAEAAETERLLDETNAENENSGTVASSSMAAASQMGVEYGVIIHKIHREYILGPEKHPLEAGKVGILPPAFDRYFSQTSSSLVGRATIRQELRPEAKGFLRMGVEQTPGQREALFALLAPLLSRNTIQEVRERILEVCTPTVFLSANFGNLVNEFFRPQDPAPPELELKRFVNRLVDTDINDRNRESLRRLFNAYQRFLEYIQNPARTKQLRHFQPLLAEPGLFFARGLQLITLEWNEESGARKSDDILPTVHCPSYGVSLDRHKHNDVAFIGRDDSGLYELFFHTDNQLPRGEHAEKHINIFRFQSNEASRWPKIVRQRVVEYYSKCQSLYRSLYTPQTDVTRDMRSLIPLSLIEVLTRRNFYGVIRDDYNHAIGVTYRLPVSAAVGAAGAAADADSDADEDGPLVILPVIDDGSIIRERHVHFGWEDCRPLANLKLTLNFYRTYLEPALALYPGYRVRYILRQRDDGYTMIQLANGIMVPIQPIPSAPAAAGEDPMVQQVRAEYGLSVKEYASIDGLPIESYVNRILAEAKCGENPELKKGLTSQQLDELYQHYRLTFANWLNSGAAGGEVRAKVSEIVFSTMPEYEKRKRLLIILGTTMSSWLQSDDEAWEGPEGFLRKDCRVIDVADGCSGVCRWRAEGEPRCRLHIPAESPLGSTQMVSTSELFMKKALDELVRFPQRRQQILRGKVSGLTKLQEPVRYGDQYIIPESSVTWTELLRLDWAHFEPDRPEFYEEMSQDAAPAPAPDMPTMPEELAAYLGPISPTTPIQFWTVESGAPISLRPFLGVIGTNFKELGITPAVLNIDTALLKKMVQKTRRTIGVIDFKTPAETAASVRPQPRVEFFKNMSDTFPNVYIFVILSNGRIGMLIRNETQPYLQVSELPESLRSRYVPSGGLKGGAGVLSRQLRLSSKFG